LKKQGKFRGWEAGSRLEPLSSVCQRSRIVANSFESCELAGSEFAAAHRFLLAFAAVAGAMSLEMSLVSSAATRRPSGEAVKWTMQIASGKVVGGRIELDTELPEGALVTVLTRDADETFEVDEATERMLLDAIAQCDSGRTVPLDKVLSDLRNDD
jgi:hypothetical protein